jgi:hypothetical protein
MDLKLIWCSEIWQGGAMKDRKPTELKRLNLVEPPADQRKPILSEEDTSIIRELLASMRAANNKRKTQEEAKSSINPEHQGFKPVA